ncbi:MAG: flagellar biosynthesis anti-sigma factor FlgM [Mariprofundaceae bacterium]
MVRISGSSASRAVEVSGKRVRSNGKAKGASKSKEQVHVADSAALRQKAHVMLAGMPEVRLEEVDAIRNALARGEYHIDSQAVSARIVSNALAERSWA